MWVVLVNVWCALIRGYRGHPNFSEAQAPNPPLVQCTTCVSPELSPFTQTILFSDASFVYYKSVIEPIAVHFAQPLWQLSDPGWGIFGQLSRGSEGGPFSCSGAWRNWRVTPKAVKVKDSVESENPKHNLGYKRCKNISPNACSRTTPMHIPRHPLAATSVEAVAALISEWSLLFPSPGICYLCIVWSFHKGWFIIISLTRRSSWTTRTNIMTITHDHFYSINTTCSVLS